MTLDVTGVPQPKGSMKAFVRGGRAVVTSDNPRLKAWQQTVRVEAQRAGVAALAGPVAIQLAFRLQRPIALSKRREAAHVTRPDVDKLARAVLDALTGVAWGDDSQVASLRATKRYAGLEEPCGVTISVGAAATGDGPPSVPVPSFAHARPALRASDWRPMRALLTPDAPSGARPDTPVPTHRRPPAGPAAAPTAAAPAPAPATGES